MLNNFELSSNTVTVWGAFDVGKGKQISKSDIQKCIQEEIIRHII